MSKIVRETMIIGDPSTFAIESGITTAYHRLSFRGLGFFTIFINGLRYGVHSSDATMLACSLDSVEARLARRGTHIATFADGVDGSVIADAVREALYAPDQEAKTFFDMSRSDFESLIYSNHLLWAPDGDEAFDDQSYVFQADIGDRVRLVGFQSTSGCHHDVGSLRDLSLDSDVFYEVLQRWRDGFLVDWKSRPKMLEEDDQKDAESDKSDQTVSWCSSC